MAKFLNYFDVFFSILLIITYLTPHCSSQATFTSSSIVDNIKCTKRTNMQKFTSIITLPKGFSVQPVFEELGFDDQVAKGITTDCSMNSMSGSSEQYMMKINNFERCGVKSEKGTDGKEWISVSLRLPRVRGLQTIEDEHIIILCRPQDPIMIKNRALDLRTYFERPPRTVFSGSSNDMEIRMGLFAKPAGVSFYSEEIPSDGEIKIGEDLQFRAIVRPGDGWNYARLKDLKVHRMDLRSNRSQNMITDSSGNSNGLETKMTTITKTIGNSKSGGQSSEMISLVMDDGCRNPQYSTLAPYHPYRDTSNPLAVAFNFKAFMFQGMPDDGSIRITAKIMACVDEIDCAPTSCSDNGQQGYGRRKRRSTDKQDEHFGRQKDGELIKRNTSDNSVSDGQTSDNLRHDGSRVHRKRSDDEPREADDRHHHPHPVGMKNIMHTGMYSSGETNDFIENFQVKVVLPGYAKRTSVNTISASIHQQQQQPKETVSTSFAHIEPSCKSMLIMISVVSALLCSATALAAICALRVRAKRIY